MAAQQIQIAETIRAMKLALKRRPDDAGDDDEATSYTNRGNKLKRRAHFVREGRLDTTGRLSYKTQVSHAGYTRTTISTNPPLFDEDGEPYSPTSSDDEQERHGEPIEENPFGEVQLEHLLRPLTAAHELVDHPSLSTAFKSKALTQMADEALEMLRKERESLWKAKRLLRRLRGEADWVPGEAFETETDWALLQHQPAEAGANGDGSSTGLQFDQGSLDMQQHVEGENGFRVPDDMSGVDATDMAIQPPLPIMDAARPTNGDTGQPAAANGNPEHNDTHVPGEATTTTTTNGDSLAPQNPTLDSLRNSAERAASETASNSNSGSGNTHRMTTRRRARSPTPPISPSPSDSASAVPSIHPWYQIPLSSLPSKDLGLPPKEAEETRRCLLLYCQKQEQVIRSLTTLHAGLSRADRLRSHVYRSAKASGHLVDDGKGNLVTEMSDGEDWYDPEEWALAGWELKDGKLEKGKDEVEDLAEEEGGRRGGRRRRWAGNKVA